MSELTYAAVVACLRKAGISVTEIGSGGKVAVTGAAGRIIGLAFSEEGENLLWANPQLADTELVRSAPKKLTGGFGGDRLWFSPELDFNWDGKPDWRTLHNYKVSEQMDPGRYRMREKGSGETLTLSATGTLPVHGQGRGIGFEVIRRIQSTEPPLSVNPALLHSVNYVGVESSHVFRIAEGTLTGRIGLWHLLQVPAGSVLVVPTRRSSSSRDAPLSYALPGDWVVKSDHVMWKLGGQSQAKFGLPASSVTGRSAVVRRLQSGIWCMIVREFPVGNDANYIDHPYDTPRSDQAFQAWDGLGFGEMEFHSPALDAEKGPTEYEESDRLWAFGGTSQAIERIASHLLGVELGYVLRSEI